MMHRLFAVAYGYLRFAFLCLLGSTSLFALSGLAIKSPSIFAVVALVGIAAFFIVRMELRTTQRARERSKRSDDPKIDARIFAGLAAYAQAADFLVGSFTETQKIQPGALWVCEIKHTPIKHTIDIKSLPDQPHSADLERAYITLALKDLEGRQKELIAHGMHPLFVSKAPAGQIVAHIMHDPLSKRYTRISLKGRNVTVTPHSLSTVFAQDRDVKITIDAVQKILGDSFQMTGGEIIDLTKA
jgi:hypothetical protein